MLDVKAAHTPGITLDQVRVFLGAPHRLHALPNLKGTLVYDVDAATRCAS